MISGGLAIVVDSIESVVDVEYVIGSDDVDVYSPEPSSSVQGLTVDSDVVEYGPGVELVETSSSGVGV